jgi:putative tricarboxylic transport membrane protein
MHDLLQHFPPAIFFVLRPWHLTIVFFGVVVGIIFGVLPGFGAAQALALMFPFTYGMDVATATLFMIAIYASAEYGGSIPAILIRTPGTTSSAMTVLEGYPMARKGLAGRALRLSLYSGVIGGFVSSLIFIFFATSLAWIGLKFGPGEMFAVGLLGLSIIGSFFGGSPTKGFLAAGLGLLLSTVGSSGFGGLRFTFNQAYLLDGFPLVVVIVAFFAMPEAIRLLVERRSETRAQKIDLVGDADRRQHVSLRDMLGHAPSLLRGCVVGAGNGTLPGHGATIGSVLAYNIEKRLSKQPEKFGTGVEEGIVAVEAANNAVVAGALIPSLALGIPGSAAIAILLGLLVGKGVVPGPMLFAENPAYIMIVFSGLIACNCALLIVGLLGVRLFAPIASIPASILGPFVFLVIMVGAYSLQSQIADVLVVLVVGLLAYFLEKLDFPMVPIVLAFVTGPIIERNLARGLDIHNGDITFLFGEPIALTIVALAVAVAVIGFRREGSRPIAMAEPPKHLVAPHLE